MAVADDLRISRALAEADSLRRDSRAIRSRSEDLRRRIRQLRDDYAVRKRVHAGLRSDFVAALRARRAGVRLRRGPAASRSRLP